MTSAVTPVDPRAGRLRRPGTRSTPFRVLLLTADTGGGHRASTEALCEEFAYRHGERVKCLVLDPITGAAAPPLVRGLARLYGPLIRHAPWLWGPVFHGTNIGPPRRALTALVTRALQRPLAEALAGHDPDVLVVLHPLLVAPANAARRGHRAQVVTVVTDLGEPHGCWLHPDTDHLVVPHRSHTRSGPAVRAYASPREHPYGLPVRRQFTVRGVSPDRDSVRTRLGLAPDRFVVMVNGGGEGARGTERWARALVTGPADVDVVAVCGRNERLRRRLARLVPPAGRRLLVTGFVDDLAASMGAVDLLVTKAGPGAIAEAAALGVPLLVAGNLPGQEAGNRERVVRAGAGIAVDSTRALMAAVVRLCGDPALLDRLRSGARRVGRPRAGALITDLIANLSKEVG